MIKLPTTILLSFFLLGNLMEHDLSLDVRKRMNLRNKGENFRINGISKMGLQRCQYCSREDKKVFESLKEAEEYFRCLLKHRDVLVGDFYGVNITAYRYTNIFDRLGYIRYKIKQIDRKIKITKVKISELMKELGK